MNTQKAGIKLTASLAGLVIVLVALIAANYIIGHVHARVDLTQNKLYSVTDGTRAILKKLDRPVQLKLFFSRSAPQTPQNLKEYMDKVEDLLAEYRKASGGKVTVEQYDTKEDSDAEEWAQKYGVPGQPLQAFGPSIYMGLVAVSGSGEAMIPVLDPSAETLLEYDITKLVYQVTHPEKPMIGVISSFPVLGGPPAGGRSPMAAQPDPPWLVFKELQANYAIDTIPMDSETIDPQISTLIVAHPKELPDKTLYAIDQFVLRGGRLIVFVDPLSVVDLQQSRQNEMTGMPPNSSSDLKKLFDAWGVGYDSGRVLADLKAATAVPMGRNGDEQTPGWLTLSKVNMDKADILTANLEKMSVPFAGSLVDHTKKGELTFSPLLTTSPDSGTVESHSVLSGTPIQTLFKPGGTNLVFAARLDGTFHSAFPNGPPSTNGIAGSTNAPPASHLAEGKSSVLIVADADILFQGLSVNERDTGFGFKIQQPFNDNLNFVMNAVEKMAGSLDLITVRCRNSFARPFDRVDALRNTASAQWSEEERRIEEDLQNTRRQISELESKKADSQRFIMSDEQKKAVEDFRAKERDANQKLKLVKKSLTRDIDSLGQKVKVANILLMPAIVIALGGTVWSRRRGSR